MRLPCLTTTKETHERKDCGVISFHIFIGEQQGRGLFHQQRHSQVLQPVQAWTQRILRVAGHIRHVPVISHRHWVVVGCGLVDHASILGVGANHGHNYSEAPDREGHHQHRLLRQEQDGRENLCLPQECLGEGAGAGGVLLCLGPRYNYAHD